MDRWDEEAEVRPEVSTVLSLFANRFGEPGRVYYPACGRDATPAVVLRNSHIVFADSEDWSERIRRVAETTMTFVVGDPDHYCSPEPFDLVLVMDDELSLVSMIRDLKIGGHLVIGDEWAGRAFTFAGLELVGVLIEGHDRKLTELVTRNLGTFTGDEADFYIFRRVAR